MNAPGSTRLLGKTALVTGGKRGIGRAIVDRFVAEGAVVMTCGRGERPENLPDSVFWMTSDVSQTSEVIALNRRFKEILGPMCVLVNNAGMQLEKNILDTTDEDWESVMGVNAKGTFLTCREMIPDMEAGGSIINIGSISANLADPGLALYNASKGFVHSLTRSIAVDHGPAIRCNAISPGWIMTEMADAAFDVADNPSNARKDALQRHPAGRMGQPTDIASMAVWLASNESEFVTGQCYVVDGGLTAASPLNPSLF